MTILLTFILLLTSFSLRGVVLDGVSFQEGKGGLAVLKGQGEVIKLMGYTISDNWVWEFKNRLVYYHSGDALLLKSRPGLGCFIRANYQAQFS